VWLYERGWFSRSRLPRPVVSVGNLTVGGTGKTPVVIHLVQLLTAQGQRVAVLSRGYRRKSAATQLLVSDGRRILATPEEAGDEPHLIATRCPGAVVAVGADRASLGRWVLNQSPVDWFVLDDGFQHLALHRDVDLLLIDATDLAGMQAALPAGRLREPLEAARRADVIMITRAATARDAEPVWRHLSAACGSLPAPLLVRFSAEGFHRITGSDQLPPDAFRGMPALLFSAVANAGSFHDLVRSLGLTIKDQVVFSDHAHYSPAVIGLLRQRARQAGADVLITTEKDAGKVSRFLSAGEPWWAVRLRTEVVDGGNRLAVMLRLQSSPAVQESRA
jgi:tetraacyldisaccharide 4'-kinase